MKVLALNSSPRSGGQSKTEMMLNSLVNGMREAGADVTVVDLRNKTIKNCAGCFSCWTKTPAICIHKDDMSRELFPEWLKSDLVVYASPLYHFTVNAQMKIFIERTLPVLEPFFIQKDGRTYHPLRNKHPKLAILSVAGFPDEAVFDQLSSWINFIYGGDHPDGKQLVAEIYRPMAEALTVPYFKEITARILGATQRAGRELVTSGSVTNDTMTQIQQPMVENPAHFLEFGNLVWKTCIAEGITPREFVKKGIVPRPDSISSYLELMILGFKRDSANGLTKTIQFNFSGENQGACFLSMDQGGVQGRQGTFDEPDLIVNAPFETWMDIVTGKADGQQMFTVQKYTVEGDLGLLMQMEQLFGVHS